MKSHLVRHHKWEYHYCVIQGKKLEEACELAKQHRADENPSHVTPTQTCSPTEFRTARVEMIVREDTPFRFAVSEGFSNVVRALSPGVRLSAYMSLGNGHGD